MKTEHKIIKLFGAALIVSLAALAFQLGYMLTHGSGDRIPAGMERDFDFSNLPQEQQSRAIRNRIVTGMKLVGSGYHYGVELGGFYSRSKQNEIQQTCEQFDKVELEFIASGISVSGEVPKLYVKGTCSQIEYQNKIAPLFIPFAKMMKKTVRDLQMEPDKKSTPTIEVKNISDSWPTEWVLNKIKITGESTDTIEIDLDEIKNIRGQHLVIELPQ